MSRYRLYIDESGDHVYSQLYLPASRFLALMGVWFRVGPASSYNLFAEGLEGLKKDVFGHTPDDPIVLHATNIIHRRRRFKVLLDNNVRQDFDNRLV